MNLYLVVSELLTEIQWEDRDANAGHKESYCIAELVLAERPSQAKWLAWRTDKNTFTGRAPEIPKMSCRKRGTFPLVITPGIVSKVPEYEFAWGELDDDW